MLRPIQNNDTNRLMMPTDHCCFILCRWVGQYTPINMTYIFNHHNHQWFWCFCCFLYTPFYGREATPSKWFVQEVGLDCKIHWFFSSWSWAKSCHQRVNFHHHFQIVNHVMSRWMLDMSRKNHVAGCVSWYPPWYLPFNFLLVFTWFGDWFTWLEFIYIYMYRERIEKLETWQNIRKISSTISWTCCSASFWGYSHEVVGFTILITIIYPMACYTILDYYINLY